MSINVILADDHPIVLQGLRRLFETAGGFEVVRCCATGEEAIDAALSPGADVLVLDYRMRGESGLDILRELAARGATCRTVMLTAAMGDAEVAEALALGLRGFVPKDSAPDALLACVREVADGRRSIDPETMTRVTEHLAARAAGISASALTPREIDVVRLVCEGLRNKDIGSRLNISEGTVKIHLHNIYEKLGVDGRLELVLCAQQRGLV